MGKAGKVGVEEVVEASMAFGFAGSTMNEGDDVGGAGAVSVEKKGWMRVRRGKLSKVVGLLGPLFGICVSSVGGGEPVRIAREVVASIRCLAWGRRVVGDLVSVPECSGKGDEYLDMNVLLLIQFADGGRSLTFSR